MKLTSLAFLILITINAFAQPPQFSHESEPISLWATYYYVPALKHDEKGLDLLNSKNKKTGFKLSLCDWCKAAIEGTVYIQKDNQGTLLNYAGRSDSIQNDCRKCPDYRNYSNYKKTGKVLWMISEGYGKGVRNYDLIPFRTIAVDNYTIPYGSVIYIPSAVGISYVNIYGETVIHDGLFFAGDTGSAINGNHIDVFIGAETVNPFPFVKSTASQTFSAYVVTDQKEVNKLLEMHR